MIYFDYQIKKYQVILLFIIGSNNGLYKQWSRFQYWSRFFQMEPIPVKKSWIRNHHDQRSKKSQNPTPEPIPGPES